MQGDDLAAAAAGLASGQVKALARPGAKSSALMSGAGAARSSSPTSPLDGDADESIAAAPTARAPPMFIPGTGVLDIDAVEAYMLGLVQVGQRSCWATTYPCPMGALESQAHLLLPSGSRRQWLWRRGQTRAGPGGKSPP